MKYAVLILDGAAGRPHDDVGGLTALAAARTPNLDALARAGRVGLARTVPEGMEPSSAAACLSIIGFDPTLHPMGRGAIEAASMGIELDSNEAAFRCNLVTVEDGRMSDHSAGHIANGDAHRLVAGLEDALGDEHARFFPGLSYRHILRLSGNGAPAALRARCTPPHDIIGKPIAGHLPGGDGAQVLLDLMRRSEPVLAAHPVNAERLARGEPPATMIWLFWGGAKPTGAPSFEAAYGMSGAMTSAVDLVGGLAAIFGLERLEIDGVTDGHDNDYAAQAEGALAALERQEHDLVVIHVESPDEAGHAGDLEGKIAAIEAIDREMVSRLAEAQERLAATGDGLRVLALPDHPTPIALRTHTADPVPFVLNGPGVVLARADRYDEDAAAATGVRVEGWRLLSELVG